MLGKRRFGVPQELLKDKFLNICIDTFSQDEKIRFYFENDDERKNIREYIKRKYIGHEADTLNSIFPDKISEESKDAQIPIITIKRSDKFWSLLQEFLYSYGITFYKLNNRPMLDSYNNELIETIFLRLKAEDVNDIEAFFRKQIEMLDYTGLERFAEEQNVGKIDFLGGSDLKIKIQLSDLESESALESKFDVVNRGNIATLPLVRFGIFNRNGERICSIGSIQNDDENTNDAIEMNKNLINSGIKNNRNVQPKKVISLIILSAIMMQLGIKKFEFQGYNILDYDFHTLLANENREDYLSMYHTLEKPQRADFSSQEEFDYANYCWERYERYYNKEESIIEAKTTRFFGLAERLLSHLNGRVISYPYDFDSNYLIELNDVDYSQLPNDATKSLVSLVDNIFKPAPFTFEDTFNQQSVQFDIEKLKQLCIKGDTNALLTMGLLYECGLNGVSIDKNEAKKCFKIGEALGDVRAAIINDPSFNYNCTPEELNSIKQGLSAYKTSSKLVYDISRVAAFKSMYDRKGFSSNEEKEQIIKEYENNPLMYMFINAIANQYNQQGFMFEFE